MILGEKDWHGEDEIYTDWYKCQKCKGTMIIRTFSFCPNCGAKIEWETKSGKGGK